MKLNVKDRVAGATMPEMAIWIASYPKSGNTWMQSVIREAGKRYGFPQRDLDVYKLIAEKRRPSVVGGIRPDVSNVATTVLKTHSRHLPHGEIHPRLGLKSAGFVHVMRNPLDLLLSYINFTRMQYERRKDSKEYQQALFIDLLGYDRAIPYEEWTKTKLEDIPRSNLDHALNRFTEMETTIPGVRVAGESWLNHAFSWLEAGKLMPSVFFKYEDLLQGPEQFLPLSRLFTFTESEIIDAVNAVNTRQGKLRANTIFFNKMRSYYYPDFFSAGVIARFLERFEGPLKQLGYTNLPERA